MNSSKFVLYHMRLFDGFNTKLKEDACVVVEGQYIRGIEQGFDPSNFPGYDHIDMNGLTVMPGLIDNHVHMSVPFMMKVTPRAFFDISKQIEKNFKTCIDAGITTVRDAGGFPRRLESMITRVDNGELPGPRVLRCNSCITTPGGCPDWVDYFNPLIKAFIGGQYAERVNTPSSAKRVVKEMIRKKADWIKIYCQSRSWIIGRGDLNIFDRRTFRTIMDTAEEYGRKVCCHVVWLGDFEYVISMGVKTTEHSILEDIPDKTIDTFVENNMAYHPTLTILDCGNKQLWNKLDRLVAESGGTFLGKEPRRQVKEFFDTYLRKEFPPSDEECQRNYYLDTDLLGRCYKNAENNTARIHRAGGRVGVATDSGGSLMSFFGILYAEELERLTLAGLSTREVLTAATAKNAEILGIDDMVGSIAPGKYADIIAVEGDPFEDIGAIKEVRYVFKGGALIKGKAT